MTLQANLTTAFNNAGIAVKAAKNRANHTGTQLAVTISDFDAAAIAAPLTGYTSGAGTVAATDTIRQAIQKLNGNVVALTTTSVAEGSNLYFTNARAIAAPLTGLSTTTATAVAAADSILVAIGKLVARLPVAVTLSSAFSSSSSTGAVVTGWTIPVVSGATYRVRVLGTYQTAATTTGGRIAFGTITATGTILGVARGAITAATGSTDLSGTLAAVTTGITTTGVSAINIPHAIEMEFIYVCTASGNIPITWASEVNLSASQLNAGSTLIYERLS
jgi:hypothetical protein